MFKTKEAFIDFIKTSTNIEHILLYELLSLPGLLSPKGLYFFIFKKVNYLIKKYLQKDQIIEKYFIDCLNYENNYMINENRDFIILINDDIYYHPIYRVQKDSKKDKKIIINKLFQVNNQINELKNYSNKSCNKTNIQQIFGNYLLFNKNIINSLKNIEIKKQYIDIRNKIKYLLLDNNLLLPLFPSGISYDYPIDTINNIKSFLSYDETIEKLNKVNKILDMDYIPKIIFYDKKEKNIIKIVSIFLENELIIPIINKEIDENEIKKLGIPIAIPQQILLKPIAFCCTRSAKVPKHNATKKTVLNMSLALAGGIN
jgi:hypothetical protein